MVHHNTDRQLGISNVKDDISNRETSLQNKHSKDFCQDPSFGTQEGAWTGIKRTMQWYFHSRALSCWALYLRNNVMYTVVCLQISTMLSDEVRECRDTISGLPIGLNKEIMGWGNTNR